MREFCDCLLSLGESLSLHFVSKEPDKALIF